MKLAGVLAPVPTPFNKRGDILYEQHQMNLRKWCQAGLHGLVILGSNGESVMLTEFEKRELWRSSREAIDNLMIAGVSGESVRACLSQLEMAASVGADAALVLTPHYYRSHIGADGVVDFYLQVAARSPLPILIYTMPSATGFDLDAASIIRIADHPNVVGVKDSSGNIGKIGAIVGSVRPDFSVLVGSGAAFYPALCMGAVGTVAALANLLPEACLELYRLFQEGKYSEAQKLQLGLIPVNHAITTRWGVPGLKAALNELGAYHGGFPRAPFKPLGEADRTALQQLLSAYQPG